MEYIDLRKLNGDELKQVRKQVVRLKEQGKSGAEIEELTGVRSNRINKGSVRFMVYDGTMTQQRLLEFLRRLVNDSPRKVFLILDNLRVHHGKMVAQWLEVNKDKIEVFFLPPYSPEINPDEYLNHALKLDVHSGKHPRTKKDLVHKVHPFMRRLQHRSYRVSAFFLHKKLAFLNSYC